MRVRIFGLMGIVMLPTAAATGAEEGQAVATLRAEAVRLHAELVLLRRIRSAQRELIEWEEGPEPGPGRLILYRDHRQPRTGPRAAGWGAKEEWRIDPVRHGTLRGVLEEWTARAGGTLVWEAEEVDYAVQAPAVYLGTFDAAVDALLRETKGRRMLVPTLWRANRYLKVREAG